MASQKVASSAVWMADLMGSNWAAWKERKKAASMECPTAEKKGMSMAAKRVKDWAVSSVGQKVAK